MTTHLFRPAASLPAPPRVSLLDVDIDNLTTAETLDRIDAALGARRSMPVAFVNADSLNKAVLDAAYLETLSAMALVLPRPRARSRPRLLRLRAKPPRNRS